MTDYDTYLMKQAERYYQECEPKPDADGDPINCIECNNNECEHYADYHETFDPALQAEMDEALLWGI